VAATTVDHILGEFWGFAYYYDRDGYVGMSDNRDGGVLDIDFPASLTTLYLTFLSHGDPENLATLKAFYVIGTAGLELAWFTAYDEAMCCDGDFQYFYEMIPERPYVSNVPLPRWLLLIVLAMSTLPVIRRA
jgi:hypothetical protein